MRKRVANVTWTIGLAALYVAAARLGLAFDAVSGFATLVWPPSGISLAALLLLGYRIWPGILIGAVTANLIADAPISVALGIGVGNSLAAVVGAYLVRRVPRFSPSLETLNSAVALIVLAALASPVISASIGVASLYVGNVIPAAKLQPTWRAWWIGDMVGVLLIAPLILVRSSAPRIRFRQRWFEAAALGAAAIDVSYMVFFSGAHRLPTLASPFHELDLLLAVLIWAALRFGPRGAATITFVVSAIAVAGTALGFGPFARPQLSDSLFLLQTFMALVAATFLLLGATIAERAASDAEARKAREDATQANLAKSEFLAVMSHELRTPLNAIAGYSDLLATGVYGPLNEKQTDAVEHIHRNEKQLLSVIEEVFGFVRAEKGEVSVQRENVQVADVFDAVEPLIEPEVHRKHVVLKRDVTPKLAVHADPKSLQQILVSLLSNASKYTDDGGMITLGAERQGTRVRIWVRDTGVGIPQEEIKRVFEPFFQAERGPTRRYSGVGLGLTIARDLARRMEGELTIASTVGRGTTASVVLPAA
ncbi:MAG TPA: MASE1 domain-containing protein [Gemmatimonadaceae bacterium]|nr:MASE1 domain-containing protein [Gemmatimonadaceae bacterium]